MRTNESTAKSAYACTFHELYQRIHKFIMQFRNSELDTANIGPEKLFNNRVLRINLLKLQSSKVIQVTICD